MAISKVSIGKYDVKNGMQSVYLQYYPPIRDKKTMKLLQKEVLGIYIYKDPQTDDEKNFNKEVMTKVEAIRGQRINALINQQYGFFNAEGLKADFLEYFAGKAVEKNEKWDKVFKHFKRFVNDKCTFGEVNIDLCRKFRAYLLNDARQLIDPEKKLSTNSVAGYYSTFRALLKEAFIEKRFSENLNEHLEKVKWEEVKKEYLTLEEVKILAETPCNIPVLKCASIFSILTGLRISDILQLEWKHIAQMPDGSACMRLRIEKTKTEATLPVSNEALAWCGTPGSGLIFKGLLRYMVYAPLKQWLKDAGIDRPVTFHCFRHTFAALQLAMGTDIYTVSKMLTHRHVSTTEIYAHLVNEKKIASANTITLK